MTSADTDRPHPRLSLRREGAVLHVTLDAPEVRNAQTPSLWTALAEVATTLPREVRVVVLAGSGTSFSAGLDRAMLGGTAVDGEPNLLAKAAEGPTALVDDIAGFQEAFTAWRDTRALVVAAVQGHAVGAGFQLALAADLRVVATDVAFVMAEVGLGLVPDLGGTAALTRLVGPSRALEICLTGRPVGAEEAVATGLASLAVAPEELTDTVADLVAAVLAAPPATAAEMLGVFRGIEDRSVTEQLRVEREAQSRLLHGLATGAAGRSGS